MPPPRRPPCRSVATPTARRAGAGYTSGCASAGVGNTKKPRILISQSAGPGHGQAGLCAVDWGVHLGRGRGAAYPECKTHIGAKRIGINKSCVVSHRGALRSAETLRGLGPRISACGSEEVAPLSLLLPRRHLSNSTLNLPSNLRGCGAVPALRVSKFILFILRSRTLFPRTFERIICSGV